MNINTNELTDHVEIVHKKSTVPKKICDSKSNLKINDSQSEEKKLNKSINKSNINLQKIENTDEQINNLYTLFETEDAFSKLKSVFKRGLYLQNYIINPFILYLIISIENKDDYIEIKCINAPNHGHINYESKIKTIKSKDDPEYLKEWFILISDELNNDTNYQNVTWIEPVHNKSENLLSINLLEIYDIQSENDTEYNYYYDIYEYKSDKFEFKESETDKYFRIDSICKQSSHLEKVINDSEEMVNTLLSVRTWEIPENVDDYLISPVEVNLVTNPNNVVLSKEGEKTYQDIKLESESDNLLTCNLVINDNTKFKDLEQYICGSDSLKTDCSKLTENTIAELSKQINELTPDEITTDEKLLKKLLFKLNLINNDINMRINKFLIKKDTNKFLNNLLL